MSDEKINFTEILKTLGIDPELFNEVDIEKLLAGSDNSKELGPEKLLATLRAQSPIENKFKPPFDNTNPQVNNGPGAFPVDPYRGYSQPGKLESKNPAVSDFLERIRAALADQQAQQNNANGPGRSA